MTYFNSKLVFTMRHIKNQIDRKISFDSCLAKTKIIQNIITTTKNSPLKFAYKYMNGPGYTATIRSHGEVVYISKCTPTSVNFTSISNRYYNK